MERGRDVVITGAGVVSPIGVGSEPFWDALAAGRSGIRRLGWPANDSTPALGAEIVDFDATKYIPRKQKKVMSRDIQLGVAAAEMACREAGVKAGAVDPERFGVVYGADMIAAELDELRDVYRACMADGSFDFHQWGVQAKSSLFPLWMLKYLPNMPACHIAIAQDARGPNNTVTLGEVSSLAAVGEAVEAIRRGHADVMIAGGASSRLHPLIFLRYRAYQFSTRWSDPAAACRPFDADRDGLVFGEGAAAFVLERREHASARGAKPLAAILSVACRCEPRPAAGATGDGIRRAIGAAMETAGLKPPDVGHVNAHAPGTTMDDRLEAQAIRDTLGDVPVTAPKSSFGHMGAAGGAMGMAVSVLAIQKGLVPQTLNYRRPDPECPVCVVADGPASLARPTAIVISHAPTGQATALVLAAPE